MHSWLRPLFVGFVVLLSDCASLDKLAPDTCGNGVVDGTEDCDSFPVGQCGAPATAGACRLACGKQADGRELTCPDGWGCGIAGFCRQPTGKFEASREPVSAGVTAMLVGDFDGDGKQDILGSSGPTSKGRIHYFNGTAAPLVVELPGVLAAPLVYDFDGDGRSDIAFGYTFRGSKVADEGILEADSQSGYAIIVGQSDREVVTKLFPDLSLPGFDAVILPLSTNRAGDLPASAAANPILGIATYTDKKTGATITGLRSLDGDPTDPTSGFRADLPGAIPDLAGDPVAAKMFDGIPSSTCGEVVIPFNVASGARVLVYSPCSRMNLKVQWSTDPPRTIDIAGEKLAHVFVADVDNDGHQDLIIGTTTSAGKRVRVAYGSPGGTELEALVDAPPDLGDVPLASGDIDLDGRTDFVLPTGVLLSARPKIALGNDAGDSGVGLDGGGAGTGSRAALSWQNIPTPTKRWTVAQIADVNRDLLPDVIGASAYEPDIDVLEGTATLVMPPFSIPTTGSVTNLVVGDFDFDHNADIAFVQARPASTEREVAISYGRALTMPPESPRPAGRLDGIRQVFVTATGLAITSSSVSASTPDGGVPTPTFALAELLSSGERQPVAPLLFAATPEQGALRRELATRALVAAPATPSTNLIGLVAQTEYVRTSGKRNADPTYGVWVAVGTGPDAFLAPTMLVGPSNLPAVDATDTFVAQMVAADLDGDKNAEVVAIEPDPTGTGAGLLVIHPGPMTSVPMGTPIVGRTTTGTTRAQLLDVDGDGHADLVAILHDTKKNILEVNVFFGDGKANLALPGVGIALTIPAGEPVDDYQSLGFTQITTGGGAPMAVGGKRRELAIITPKHLFRAFMSTDRTLTVCDTFKMCDGTTPFGSITYGSAVVAGDFDGDGVDDLAIADQGSIRISRQTPRLP